MIRRILHIARREWLEQLRQPAMLSVIATLYGLVAALVLIALFLLQNLQADPGQLSRFLETGEDPEAFLQFFVGGTVNAYNFLLYSQFLGIAAVLAGHAVLHDRQCGTLTFLLLAPVRRTELLIGKVIGAVGPPFLLYLLISGPAAVLASTLSITAPFADQLPGNPAWWVAFLIGGPMWAVFIGSICTIVSSLAHDVRTAQQGVWFVVFFATLTCGFLLTWALPYGVLAQLAVAGLAAFGAGATQLVGAALMSRDVSR